MAVEHINETDTLNQGRVKINAILDQSNASSEKVSGYEDELTKGIEDAKQIATDAGAEAVRIASDATAGIEATANQANANSQTAINTANNAVSTANQNKQEFDQLRNDFDDLVAEAGDSNPEIVQARTDTTGIKQTTLANRLSVDFADRMTKADGIELFSGQTNVKKMMDFTGKTAGNTATNPHQAYSDFTAKALKKPSDSWNEVAQNDYNKLASRDDSGVSTGSSASGVIPQQLYKLNAVEAVKSLAPQLFDGLDVSQSVQFVKNNFVSLVLTIRGKASSPNNKNLKVSTYLDTTDSWSTQSQGAATEYTDFTVQINDSNFIGSDGFVYAVAYSDMTNGVTASSIDVDYVGVSVEVSINAQDVLSKGGFAKKEDIDTAIQPLAKTADLTAHATNQSNPHGVSKSQVGLGNVQNCAVASQDDAETGTATDKYMTPQRVFQSIAKWIGDKFVKKTGDESIAGIKDFQSVPTINGVPVALDTGVAYKEVTAPTDTSFNGGTVFFWRIGNIVICSMSIQTKGYVGWKNLVEVPEGFRAQQSAGASTVIGSSSTAGVFGTVYTSGTNLQILTQSGATAGTYKGSFSWYTAEDFPS